MKSTIKIFYVFLIVLFYGCIQSKTTSDNTLEQPNILWIMAEDIGLDLECYDTPAVRTPVLNQLAGEGVLFTKAYGTNSICSPSRSNMITGVHQNVSNTQHHRSNRQIPLKTPYKPITSYLRDAGYTTILGSHLVRGKGRKIDVNFKHKPLGKWDGISQFGLFDKHDSIQVTDQPFFAQVTLAVTHRGDWWNQIRKESEHPVDPAKVILPPYFADNEIIREDWAKYLDQIEYMDNEVGLLLADLETKGMRDNTIVIFVGDNGRCNIRGKGYLYDPGLHIPLIVNWPAKLSGGKNDERLVSTIDIAASILEAAGVTIPDYMTAKPFINNEDHIRDYVYSARDLWDEVLEQSRAITTTKYRYIRNNVTDQAHDAQQAYLEFHRPAVHIMRGLKENGKLNDLQLKFFDPQKEFEELYDLQKDPHETTNLIKDPMYSEVLVQMRSNYEDWNCKNRDHGLEQINWNDVTLPKATNVLKWLEEEKPEILEQMRQGIEPGYGKIGKAYRERKTD